jgi:hypothetical protein
MPHQLLCQHIHACVLTLCSYRAGGDGVLEARCYSNSSAQQNQLALAIESIAPYAALPIVM